MITKAYKLLRIRKDGSLGPLFINCKQRMPYNKWIKAEPHKTKGFAFRPGWHVILKPEAPHLSKIGRVWCEVLVKNYIKLKRPQNQGGIWLLAKYIKIKHIIEDIK